MDAAITSARRWAREEFGQVEAGDKRRRERAVAMAAVAAATPFGTVARTFRGGAERQGAYDLLESKKVDSAALIASMSAACVERGRGSSLMYVPIDGSSLSLVDRRYRKNFGPIGSRKNGARGLKVITAIGVAEDGTSLGICGQRWWARPLKRSRSKSKYRPIKERESHRWVEVIEDVRAAFDGSQVAPVCIIDREGDATEMLHALVAKDMHFIVRSSWNRRLVTSPLNYLRPVLATQPVLGTYTVEVTAGPRRKARTAQMELRVGRVTLDLKHDWQAKRPNIELTAVWAKEVAPPAGEKALHWILLTNLPVSSKKAARKIVRAYTLRWRIEEFHKAWKSGTCNVENTQLRTKEAVSTWATMLAAVAIRAERLKQRSRNEPEIPASAELSDAEIEALILLKKRQKKKTETVPDSMPTLAQAILWIAHLGSYDGKKTKNEKGEMVHRPGTITISRGLAQVLVVAEAIEALREAGKIR